MNQTHAMEAVQVCSITMGMESTTDNQGLQLAKNYLGHISQKRVGDKGKYQESEWHFDIKKVSINSFE
jgi:hypothetical protein